jgi:hypothetical protein
MTKAPNARAILTHGRNALVDIATGEVSDREPTSKRPTTRI